MALKDPATHSQPYAYSTTTPTFPRKRHNFPFALYRKHKDRFQQIAASPQWQHRDDDLKETPPKHTNTYIPERYAVSFLRPEPEWNGTTLVHTAPYAPRLCHSIMQYAGRDGKVNHSLNGREVEGFQPIGEQPGFRPTFVINGLWIGSCDGQGEAGGNFRIR